jgi:hypothetical protein
MAIVAAGAFLISSQWFGGAVPAALVSSQAVEKVTALYTEEMAALNAAGGIPAGSGPDDRLEQAIRILDDTLRVVPMDSYLHYLKGAISLYFDDRDADIDQEFAIGRGLDPVWVAMPLIQGTAWARIDPAQAQGLWAGAMERAASLERIDPITSCGRKRTFARIMRDAASYPGLVPYAIQAAGNDAVLLEDWAAHAPDDVLDTNMPEVLSMPFTEDFRKSLFKTWRQRGSAQAVQEYIRSHPEWSGVR